MQSHFLNLKLFILSSGLLFQEHYNISQLLSELIRIGRDSISQYTEIEDPLLLTLERKDTVENLVTKMFEDLSKPTADSVIMAGIGILSSMMEIKRPVIEGMEELITPIDLERIANGMLNSYILQLLICLLYTSPSPRDS